MLNEADAARKPFFLIQALRGVAALLVVAHHALILWVERLGGKFPVWSNGAAGVDIFFVISGFVMALSSHGLVSGAAPGIEFMKRRVERIVPLYWLATTLKVALVLAVPVAAVNGLGNWWHVAASYLLLPTYDPEGSMTPVLVVGWTLMLEMMFYVFFAVALALRWRPLALLVPAICAVVLLPWVPQLAWTRWVVDPNPIALEFLLGMGLYALYRRGAVLKGWMAVVCGLAGFGVLLVVSCGRVERPLVWGLAALAIVMAAVGLEPGLGWRMPGWVREIGDASYSIYLSHTFVLPVAGMMLHNRVHGAAAVLAALAVGVGASTLVGLALYRAVELPMIRYFRGRRLAAVPTGT